MDYMFLIVFVCLKMGLKNNKKHIYFLVPSGILGRLKVVCQHLLLQ